MIAATLFAAVLGQNRISIEPSKIQVRLTATDGRVHTSASLQGKPTVLVLFNHACPHNPRITPSLNRLAKDLSGKATVLGVVNLDMPKAKAFMRTLKATVPLISDDKRQLIDALGGSHSLDIVLLQRDKASRWNGFSRKVASQIASDLGIKANESWLAKYPAERLSGCGFSD